jgi:hypothetical protein
MFKFRERKMGMDLSKLCPPRITEETYGEERIFRAEDLKGATLIKITNGHYENMKYLIPKGDVSITKREVRFPDAYRIFSEGEEGVSTKMVRDFR